MPNTFNNFQTETVFSIASEKEMIESFRLRDQKKLILPDQLKFPFKVRSYYTWKEASGVYTYLIFKKPNWDMPRGMAFKRLSLSGEASTGGMCSWCHAYGSSEEIGHLSVVVNANVSFSYILCQDLRCIEKIEEAANLSGKNPEKAIDQLYYKISQMFEGISNYEP